MAMPIGAWVNAAWNRATASRLVGLGPLAARDVLDVQHEARRAALVAPHERRVELDPHGVAVGVAEPDVDVEAVDRVVEGAAG